MKLSSPGHDDALTDGADIWHTPVSGLETKNSRIPCRNTYTPPNVRTDTERRAVRREQRALTA
jgi:hypothetical protein